jgi:RimJ/RimL family protein N-acetyltransferase
MMHSGRVALRARQESDIAVLHAELYEDVEMRSRADTRPWRPIPARSPASPFAVAGPTDDAAVFSVVELAGSGLPASGPPAGGPPAGELAGEALLWSIDTHNRSAHLGLSLRPAFRGRGLGTDAVRALCGYGFRIRGLHRLQLETLTDNAAMIRAAIRAGFTREGTLRRCAWVDGGFLDVAVFGLLVPEWDMAVGGSVPGRLAS